MQNITEKQILSWKEELDKQIKTRDHAKKVFDESTLNINVLQGGIQFGENLLKQAKEEETQADGVELQETT
tara:strand:- start:370 stop:582 length:213 start_codon:yes stop_codon:yes gene_type:complete